MSFTIGQVVPRQMLNAKRGSRSSNGDGGLTCYVNGQRIFISTASLKTFSPRVGQTWDLRISKYERANLWEAELVPIQNGKEEPMSSSGARLQIGDVVRNCRFLLTRKAKENGSMNLCTSHPSGVLFALESDVREKKARDGQRWDARVLRNPSNGIYEVELLFRSKDESRTVRGLTLEKNHRSNARDPNEMVASWRDLRVVFSSEEMRRRNASEGEQWNAYLGRKLAHQLWQGELLERTRSVGDEFKRVVLHNSYPDLARRIGLTAKIGNSRIFVERECIDGLELVEGDVCDLTLTTDLKDSIWRASAVRSNDSSGAVRTLVPSTEELSYFIPSHSKKLSLRKANRTIGNDTCLVLQKCMNMLGGLVQVDAGFRDPKSELGIFNGLVFRPLRNSQPFKGSQLVTPYITGRRGIYAKVRESSRTSARITSPVILPVDGIPSKLAVHFCFEDDISSFGIVSGLVFRPINYEKGLNGWYSLSGIEHRVSEGFIGELIEEVPASDIWS